MRKKFKRSLRFITFLIICLIGLLIAYFIYNNFFKPNQEIKVAGSLSINYQDGSHLNIFKNKKTKLTIINNSDEDVYYYIEFLNPKNTDNVTFNLKNDNGINISDSVNSFNTTISSFILIKAGSIENYDLIFTSDKNKIYALDLNINVENLETFNFADVVLNNNEVKDESITKVGKEIATIDEGLIKSNDDSGITYYFRGNVKNNNVKLGDYNFKILRINGDGSVRLVLDGGLDIVHKYYSSIENYTYQNSEINSYINNWINDNLGEYSKYLASGKFCNDYLSSEGEFLAYTRIHDDNIPSFSCLGEKVISKGGLLSADEVLFAGANMLDDNKEYFLFNDNIDTNYFTMTSAKETNDAYYPFIVNSSGKLAFEDGSLLRLVRPVINIIKTATVTGSGSISDPYLLTSD